MITLKHGDTENGAIPTMAIARDAQHPAMIQRAKAGEKVKGRVANVVGTLVVVRLVAQ
nr:copper-binding protein [Paraburkholderia sp. BL8N3]